MSFLNDITPDYTQFSDVFQTEAGTTIGYARKNLSLTATAGTVVQIGTLLVDNGDGTATIPATALALSSAAAGNIVIFCGDDIYNKQVGHRDWNPNLATFDSTNLTQNVTVMAYGRVGVGKAKLVWPSNVTTADKVAVYKRLEKENGFKVIRQLVPHA